MSTFFASTWCDLKPVVTPSLLGRVLGLDKEKISYHGGLFSFFLFFVLLRWKLVRALLERLPLLFSALTMKGRGGQAYHQGAG
jgi:hypothetical protein